MALSRTLFSPLLVLLISKAQLPASDLPARSVSPSGQFVVYGADSSYRGAVSALAERTKSNLLAVLKRRDAWKTAVVINLQPREVNLPDVPPSALRFSQTEAGAKLQLDLTVSRELSPAAIERELARVILVEMIYRDQARIPTGDQYVDPPSWLIEGLLASAPNQNRSALASALLSSSGSVTVAEFLNGPPEIGDSFGRQLHRAYSFVLVRLLIDSPSGPSRLGHYIDNLAFASNDPVADLRVAFPELRNLDAAWKSKVIELKSILDNDLLSFAQADERLTQLVLLKFPSRDGGNQAVSLEDLSRTLPTPVQKVALRDFSRKLVALAIRANPMLRPIIQDYQRIADQLALGSNRGIEKRLADLKSLRMQLAARMGEIDSYMDWFEAVKLTASSGMFDDGLQPADNHGTQKPRRKDALSVYLDAMEIEF